MAISVCLLLTAPAVKANDPFGSVYGDEVYTSIATGTEKRAREAPAIVTVIDQKQIRQSSARTLEEVLESVAGIHVSYSQGGYTPIYFIRGINSEFNQQALTMINDVPVTHPYNGDTGVRWTHMPLSVIEKIEIVRGPGSVLYGADAYAGVINILTKNNQAHISSLTLSQGSFNTTAISGQNTVNLMDDWELGITFEAGMTRGFDSIVESDFQSELDQITGTNASLAPGPVNAGKKWLDIWTQARDDNWTLNFGYQGRYDTEMVIGWNGALDEKGREKNGQFLFSGKYFDELTDTASLEHLFSLFYSKFTSHGIYLLPEGNALYPNGLFSAISFKETVGRYNLALNLKPNDNHTLRFGLETSISLLYDLYEARNFNSDFSPTANNELIENTGNDPDIFLRNATRKNIAIYAQDEYTLNDQSTLTLGFRFDHYTDFGSTFNPRAAWVYEFNEKVTSKLLYGSAFLAPSIYRLYAINNPVRLGNPELKPDQIKTVEASLIFQLDHDELLSVNIYRNSRDDIIELVNNRYENFGQQTGIGLEIEYQNDLTPLWTVRGNAAIVRAEDQATGMPSPSVPQKQFFAQSLFRITPETSATIEGHYVADRARIQGDSRSDIDDNHWINLAFLYEPADSNLYFKLGLTKHL